MKALIIPLLVLLFFAYQQLLQAEEVLTWQQCVSEASKAHPDLYSAQAKVQQAESDKRIAGGQLLPQVSASISGSQSGTSERHAGSSSSFSYSLTARQLLYDGRKISKEVSAYSESINAAQHQYREISASLRFALRSAYTDLLKAQELVGLTREIAERREKNLRMINLRYLAGREHIGSLRKAEADLSQSTFDVLQAERGFSLAQSKLASALGRDLREPIRVKGSFSETDKLLARPDFALLARNSPQVLQREAGRKSARYELDAAKSAFSPQLYLTSTVGRNAFDSWLPEEIDWNAGVNISIPIYGGGTGRAKVAKAMAVLSQQNADQKSGYLQVLDTLEESWKKYADAYQYVAVQKKYLDASVERSTIANAQYSNGLISFNDWVIIEDNLVSAKKGFLNAGADFLVAEATWILATGGGLDDQ